MVASLGITVMCEMGQNLDLIIKRMKVSSIFTKHSDIVVNYFPVISFSSETSAYSIITFLLFYTAGNKIRKYFASDFVLILGSQNSKCQLLANFSFSGRGGVFLGSQNSKCQLLVNFSFAKFCPIFHFRGEGGGYSRIGYSWQNEQKFCHAKLSLASQIVSHTLRVWRLKRSSCNRDV